jgi:hypothetical protein
MHYKSWDIPWDFIVVLIRNTDKDTYGIDLFLV